MAPLISIITITFNAEKVLTPTVDSVAEQTFRDFEHIIVDGASTDATLDIARRNPDARILSERDNGLYDAMNKGIGMAKGRYLLFLNAGDSFRTPEILSMYAQRALAGDDIIYADTMIVDRERNDIAPRHHTAPEILTHDSFAKGMLICHQAFMVRREIVPLYDTGYRFSADYDWTVRCIDASSPLKNTNLHCYAINYLSDGLTDKNKYKSLLERFRIMCHHYGKLPTILHHIKLLLHINKT